VAKQEALERCSKFGSDCRIYAVDEQAVGANGK
jgi:hypothetical protein